jgi:hypothetical protein
MNITHIVMFKFLTGATATVAALQDEGFFLSAACQHQFLRSEPTDVELKHSQSCNASFTADL